jgi:hypothetical protein
MVLAKGSGEIEVLRTGEKRLCASIHAAAWLDKGALRFPAVLALRRNFLATDDPAFMQKSAAESPNPVSLVLKNQKIEPQMNRMNADKQRGNPIVICVHLSSSAVKNS